MIDKLVSEHLSFERVCVYSLVTFGARDLKGGNSPSLGTPKTICRPPFGFEMSQIKRPKVRGIEKYCDLL